MTDSLSAIPECPDVVEFSRRLLASHRNLVGVPLIESTGDRHRDSRLLFDAAVVVVAHGIQPDPILCYGNRAALTLWGMSWEDFTKTPSRLTAEPVAREDRERLLREALTQGFSRDYRGVRISSTGKRFWIEDVTLWNVLDDNQQRIGQAAAFAKWTPLSK